MKMKRAGGVLAAVFAAAALPIVVASPASAAQRDCQYVVFDAGYTVGPKVQAACKFGATILHPGAFHGCYVSLVDIGVRDEIASRACSEAARA
ncbi:hypothetical protein OOK31_30665 [Streptomyces sp. NBC_00249]|uniref:hypothetical protein n=1 Tax=Streptomyces sp. NBC_00249 TaxID=2975690 RepID=UPI00224E8DBC|nr:hypothetical protein [Streptomyces sp. NBC_00249]MCX5198204.1 hypothetical protein [Streptomyces sp. NBC_00249]